MQGSVLERKRACVTGATGGIGAAIAESLAREGCKLLLVGRDGARLAAAQEALEEAHDVEVDICVADLATLEGIDEVVRHMTLIGGVDVLVNSAGVFPVKSILETTARDLDECFAVNVRAPFLLSQAVVRQSIEHGHGWGRIVNIGSSSAYAGFANTSVYCASKHALLGASRSFHAELKGTSIRTSCVSPGSVKTEMGRAVVGQDYETFLEPDDVARVVLFVLRDESNASFEELRINRHAT